jgi:Glycosyl transferase family 2
MAPTISVVIPVHNRFELTTLAVESVLAQTLGVLEVIPVDDGSTDGTSGLLSRRIQEDAAWRKQVRLFHQEYQAVSGARNRGVVLEGMRAASLKTTSTFTWTAAGARLLDVYRETIEACAAERSAFVPGRHTLERGAFA